MSQCSGEVEENIPPYFLAAGDHLADHSLSECVERADHKTIERLIRLQVRIYQ
jgi:hypothetical protein